MLCDIDPRSLGSSTGTRVLNFGFNTVALSPEYIDAAVRKLDPASRVRTLVIGIAPRALTPLNTRVSGYVEENTRPWDEKFFNLHLNRINSLLRPITLPALVRNLMQARRSEKDFFPAGWMSVSLRPPNPSEDLGVYRRIFLNNAVSESMQKDLLAKLSQVRSSGVRIVAFRPPVAPALLDAEESMSGFEQDTFVKRLNAVGVEWLPQIEGSFLITDGSHIDANDAPRYSALLGAALKKSGRAP